MSHQATELTGLHGCLVKDVERSEMRRSEGHSSKRTVSQSTAARIGSTEQGPSWRTCKETCLIRRQESERILGKNWIIKILFHMPLLSSWLMSKGPDTYFMLLMQSVLLWDGWIERMLLKATIYASLRLLRLLPKWNHTHTQTHMQAFNSIILGRGIGTERKAYFSFWHLGVPLNFSNFHVCYFYFENSTWSYLTRKNIFFYFLFSLFYIKKNVYTSTRTYIWKCTEK